MNDQMLGDPQFGEYVQSKADRTGARLGGPALVVAIELCLVAATIYLRFFSTSC